MKKYSKLLTTALCAAALVGASILGTMAYFTDNEAVVNTFTVGNVDITLDETDVDNDNNQDDNRTVTVGDETIVRDKANEYHLLPGHTYVKDPMVTVKAGSEKSYVRMLVTVENIEKLKAALTAEKYYSNDIFLLQTLVGGWDADTWQYESYTLSDDANNGVYEFRYKEIVDGFDTNGNKAPKELDALFETITVPGEDITNDNIGNLAEVKIEVTAQAIQADGFNTADAAWGEFPTTN